MTINNHYIITMNPHNFPWNRQVQLPSLEALAQAQAQALQVQVAQAQMLAQAQAAWVFHRQIKTHVWYIETRHKLVKSYTNLHEIRFTEQIFYWILRIYIYMRNIEEQYLYSFPGSEASPRWIPRYSAGFGCGATASASLCPGNGISLEFIGFHGIVKGWKQAYDNIWYQTKSGLLHPSERYICSHIWRGTLG